VLRQCADAWDAEKGLEPFQNRSRHFWANRSRIIVGQVANTSQSMALLHDWTSSQYVFYHRRLLHAGELYIEPLKFIGEPVVIDAELVEDGRLEVANVDAVRDNVVGEIISLAVHDPRFDARSGHSDGVA